ncbi:nuclear transcription factor Y subunit B [Panicum miliaceum]|uniref:Nuclear transcription factor Y subunit B n=1 Tax=Panicum miliaceum TaxID=4540 RepID=A0A3L6R7S9_PANMI|nr:nuclear transcription factor Y subunit B [Panicum miliaceum]
MEGDSKLTAKAGDGSIKKDALGHGGASSSATQGMGQQGAYNQAMGYMQPQVGFSLQLFTKTPCGEQLKSSNQPPQQAKGEIVAWAPNLS